MSRGFFGGGGLGGGKNPFSKKSSNSMMFSRKRKRSMQEMMDDRATHKIKSQKDMISDKMDEMMFSTTKKSHGFHLPGTSSGEDGERKFSKGYLRAMEFAQQRQMKKKMKKRDQAVKIIPKAFGGAHGGRIDANGKITNNKGQVLLKVNLETGIITDSMGMKVGRYKPFSHSMDHKIEKLIEKYSMKAGFGSGGANLGLFGGGDDKK